MKAQVSFEYYFSLVLFVMLAMYVVFQTISVTSVYRTEVRNRLIKAEAYQISELLVNDLGEPINWNTQAFWLLGWQYRQTIIIDNTASGNALTDYQVLIILNTTSLISQGKMNSDCSDIRFTDSYGTLINYWLESGCNSANTKIWVKVPSIPASSTQPIYVYYGNPTANTASNATATFDAYRELRSGFYNALGAISLTTYPNGGDPGDYFISSSQVSSVYVSPVIWFRSYGGKKYSVASDNLYFYGYVDGGNYGTCGIDVRMRTSPAPTGWQSSNSYKADTSLNKKFIVRMNYTSSGTSAGDLVHYSSWSVGDDIPSGTVVKSVDLPSTTQTIMTDVYTGNIAHIRIESGSSTNWIRIYSFELMIAKYTSPEPTTSIGAEENKPTVEIKRIGLSDESMNKTNLLSTAKIQSFNNFCSTNYQLVANQLGITEDYQFEVFITDLTSNTLLASCSPPTRISRGKVAEVTRIAALDSGSYVRIIVRVW
jgi:hypothetical protein